MKYYTKTHFRVAIHTVFGEKVRILGSDTALGNWDVEKGVELTTNDELYPVWVSREPICLELKKKIWYKYVVVSEFGKLVREVTQNEPHVLIPTGVVMTVEDDDGLARERTRSFSAMASSPDAMLAGDNEKREERETNITLSMLHKQNEEPQLNENDTLFIVALELPVKVERSNQGFQVHTRCSALLPSLFELRHSTKIPVKFVGWPGIMLDNDEEKMQVDKLLEEYDCICVHPPKGVFENFLRFCYVLLRPLFHNFMILDSRKQEPFNNDLWCCYQKMNKIWTDRTLEAAHESDIIWVHGLHFLLVPMNYSRRFRRGNLGLFLHSPFPSSEIFRCLPVREIILRGMLCADLIGFQFFEYARHFLVVCKRMLGLEHRFWMGGFLGVEYGGRNVAINIGHAQIHFDSLIQRIDKTPSVEILSKEIRAKFNSKFIFVAVDRCDKLGGLLLKMRAFEYLLDNYPYAQGHAILIQHAFPSINCWEDEEDLRTELVQLVDKINHKFNMVDDDDGVNHTCEKHIYLHLREIEWDEKIALYQAGDCYLDTSIRDGLNLNPFEYISCRKGRPGGVILSEFTGSRRALASAICCNPWKISSVAESMDIAYWSSKNRTQLSFMRDQNYLKNMNTLKWAETYIYDLIRARKSADMVYTICGIGNTFRFLGLDSHFKYLDTEEVIRAVRNSKRRVFFLDYEGTLAPDWGPITSPSGFLGLSGKGFPPSKTTSDLLRCILKDPHNTIIILSGRDKKLLEEWFGDIEGIGLCAEHGFYFRLPIITGNEWLCLSRERNYTWKRIAFEMMAEYARRTQGSIIENKGSSLVFQYRDADHEFGAMQSKELSNYLSELLFGYPVSVVSGKGYLEVKLRGVNKGEAVDKVLRNINDLVGDVDFVICIGDDRSDEDMFVALRQMYGRNDSTNSDISTEKGHTRSLEQCGRQYVASQNNLNWSRENLQKTNTFSPSSEKVHQTTKLDRSVSTNPDKSAVCRKFFSCTIGKKQSHAEFYLNDSDEVIELLRQVSQHCNMMQKK